MVKNALPTNRHIISSILPSALVSASLKPMTRHPLLSHDEDTDV
jgi:hypothetical protein